MPFVTPYTVPAGAYQSANVLDTDLDNAQWFWNVAARDWDTFTGAIVRRNNTIGAAAFDIWRGYFRWTTGISQLLGKVTCSAGNIYIYISDDAGEHLLDSQVAADLAFPYNIGAYTFTNHGVYRVRIKMDGAANRTADVYYLAMEQKNSFSWPTLIAWTDGGAPSYANFQTIETAEKYLNGLVPPYGYGVRAASFANGIAAQLNRGAFYVRKNGSTLQDKLTVEYQVWPDATVAKLYVYDDALALQDTIALTTSTVLRTDTYTLAGTYTANAVAYWVFEQDSNHPATDNYIARVTIGGTATLTHPVAYYNELDVLTGSSGAKRLAYLAGSASDSNLNECRTLLRGSGSDNAFMFLTADATLGEVDWYLPNAVGYTLGPDMRRLHTARYLFFRGSGTLTYGTNSVTLSETIVGAWNYVDLLSETFLAPGAEMVLTGVIAAFEFDSV